MELQLEWLYFIYLELLIRIKNSFRKFENESSIKKRKRLKSTPKG